MEQFKNKTVLKYIEKHNLKVKTTDHGTSCLVDSIGYEVTPRFVGLKGLELWTVRNYASV